MQPITSKEIKNILNLNQEIIETTIKDISTDSRKLSPNTLFIAIKGEKFDGHDFIKDVLKTAPLVISDHAIVDAPSSRVIVVKDTLKALGALASYNRSLYKGTVIALTGSSGKTTTKELLKTALSNYGKTYATSGNFNNHIGVPRSLLDIEMDSQFAIIEMGMSALGEISYLTSLTKPDIALLTNVYPMHIEYLKTLENIALAKSEIFQGLSPQGIAIYNQEASLTSIIHQEAQKYTSNIHTYSTQDDILNQLNLADNSPHCQSNASAVLKVISLLNLNPEKSFESINNFTAPEGRGKKHNLTINNNSITLIDDSYSGQPDAMKLAIKSLGSSKTSGRKIALLGKMSELGDYSITAHKEVGQTLKENNIDIVIGVCEETKDILSELSPITERYYFDDHTEVSDFLITKLLKNNDTILIKGSHYSSKVYMVANTLKQYQS
jgi:UDP-N-acetylmuramoyl-tripeptide--D-alanyl-D-alanine ligase